MARWLEQPESRRRASRVTTVRSRPSTNAMSARQSRTQCEAGYGQAQGAATWTLWNPIFPTHVFHCPFVGPWAKPHAHRPMHQCANRHKREEQCLHPSGVLLTDTAAGYCTAAHTYTHTDSGCRTVCTVQYTHTYSTYMRLRATCNCREAPRGGSDEDRHRTAGFRRGSRPESRHGLSVHRTSIRTYFEQGIETTTRLSTCGQSDVGLSTPYPHPVAPLHCKPISTPGGCALRPRSDGASHESCKRKRGCSAVPPHPLTPPPPVCLVWPRSQRSRQDARHPRPLPPTLDRRGRCSGRRGKKKKRN